MRLQCPEQGCGHAAHARQLIEAFQRRSRRPVIETGRLVFGQEFLYRPLCRTDPFGDCSGEVTRCFRRAANRPQQRLQQHSRGKVGVDASGFVLEPQRDPALADLHCVFTAIDWPMLLRPRI
jgi:hypothetical protein